MVGQRPSYYFRVILYESAVPGCHTEKLSLSGDRYYWCIEPLSSDPRWLFFVKCIRVFLCDKVYFAEVNTETVSSISFGEDDDGWSSISSICTLTAACVRVFCGLRRCFIEVGSVRWRLCMMKGVSLFILRN